MSLLVQDLCKQRMCPNIVARFWWKTAEDDLSKEKEILMDEEEQLLQSFWSRHDLEELELAYFQLDSFLRIFRFKRLA